MSIKPKKIKQAAPTGDLPLSLDISRLRGMARTAPNNAKLGLAFMEEAYKFFTERGLELTTALETLAKLQLAKEAKNEHPIT